MVAVISTHNPLRVSFTAGTVRTKPRVFHIKAQTEEGRWSNYNNMVDASRSVLQKRIDQVKMKDRLERCWSCGELGWNYNHSYSSTSQDYYKNKKPTKTQAVVSELSEMAILVSTTLTLTCMSGTAFLALASLLIHHHHL